MARASWPQSGHGLLQEAATVEVQKRRLRSSMIMSLTLPLSLSRSDGILQFGRRPLPSNVAGFRAARFCSVEPVSVAPPDGGCTCRTSTRVPEGSPPVLAFVVSRGPLDSTVSGGAYGLSVAVARSSCRWTEATVAVELHGQGRAPASASTVAATTGGSGTLRWPPLPQRALRSRPGAPASALPRVTATGPEPWPAPGGSPTLAAGARPDSRSRTRNKPRRREPRLRRPRRVAPPGTLGMRVPHLSAPDADVEPQRRRDGQHPGRPGSTGRGQDY